MVSCAVVGPDAEPPRVAYAVGRRVGSAVVRNRVRRRLRAATHAHAETLVAGRAYLVSVGGAAAASTYAELSESLHDAFRALREEMS